MITEFAELRIKAGQQAVFEEAIERGVRTVIAQATGYRGHRIERCIESPLRYLLQIDWELLEDHTVGFRGSPAFTRWREIVGPFFAEPPQIEHFERIADKAA